MINFRTLFLVFFTMSFMSSAFAWQRCIGRCCISKPPADPKTGLPGQLTISCRIGALERVSKGAASQASDGVETFYNSCAQAISAKGISADEKAFIKSSEFCQAAVPVSLPNKARPINKK